VRVLAEGTRWLRRMLRRTESKGQFRYACLPALRNENSCAMKIRLPLVHLTMVLEAAALCIGESIAVCIVDKHQQGKPSPVIMMGTPIPSPSKGPLFGVTDMMVGACSTLNGALLLVTVPTRPSPFWAVVCQNGSIFCSWATSSSCG